MGKYCVYWEARESPAGKKAGKYGAILFPESQSPVSHSFPMVFQKYAEYIFEDQCEDGSGSMQGTCGYDDVTLAKDLENLPSDRYC